MSAGGQRSKKSPATNWMRSARAGCRAGHSSRAWSITGCLQMQSTAMQWSGHFTGSRWEEGSSQNRAECQPLTAMAAAGREMQVHHCLQPRQAHRSNSTSRMPGCYTSSGRGSSKSNSMRTCQTECLAFPGAAPAVPPGYLPAHPLHPSRPRRHAGTRGSPVCASRGACQSCVSGSHPT